MRVYRKSKRKDCRKTEEIGDILSINPYKMEIMLEEGRSAKIQ
jgi:hypothetical protein